MGALGVLIDFFVCQRNQLALANKKAKKHFAGVKIQTALLY